MHLVGPEIASYYSRLDTVLADGSRQELRRWLFDVMRWFAENHTLIRVLDQVHINQPEITTGVINWPFTDHMPRYLARWPVDKQGEAKLRLWLAVTLLTRIELLWPLRGPTPHPADDAILDILTDLWASSLKTT